MKRLLLSILLSFLIAAPASAAPVSLGSYAGINDSYYDQKCVAQSFIPAQAGLLKTLKIFINSDTDFNPNGYVYAEIYSGNTFGSGTLLGTSNNIDYSLIPEAPPLNESSFIFSPEISLIENENYYYKIISTETQGLYRKAVDSSGMYPNGESAYSGNCLSFTVEGTADSSFNLLTADLSSLLPSLPAMTEIIENSTNYSSGFFSIILPVIGLMLGLLIAALLANTIYQSFSKAIKKSFGKRR